MIKIIFRKSMAILLSFTLILSLLTPFLQTPFSPKLAYAQNSGCLASSTSTSGTNSTAKIKTKLKGRVGGVALDQAAKFLADMSEVTGAYYDQNLDRIVFVGKKNTTAPKFDRDDLAVAIKAIMFYGEIPWVSLESTNPDPNYVDAVYSPGIENTRFGNVLVQADYKLKQYVHGYDTNNQKINSNVPGYKSAHDRIFEAGPPPYGTNDIVRYWITPQLITLSKDDAASAFIFETTKMQVKTEMLGPDYDPAMKQGSEQFSAHFTQNYDLFAQESPIFYDTKRLGQIAAVVKWINDSGIATDFYWARDYAVNIHITQKSFKKIYAQEYFQEDGSSYAIEGGANLFTANTYTEDTTGDSSSLKNSSQSTPTTKEDIHWTFTKDSQQYETVAVTADAFRSIGSYNTLATDMSFPTAGDLTLSFQRAYSSFSGGQYGIGRGWNIYPASLFDNKPAYPSITFPCSNGNYPKSLSFVSQTGGFESFTINDCNIGYVADDPAYHSKVFRNTDGTFTVRLKDQTEFNFDQNFKLTNIKDKNGNTISYIYDGSGKLTGISDNKNHQITLSYNNENLISQVSDWSGRQVKYEYDADGNLIKVIDPNNNATQYSYDANFKLTSIKNREGQTIISNTYTDEAKVATQKDAENKLTTYNYDHTNRIITASDNLGSIEKTKYDTKARILERTDPLLYSLKHTYGSELTPLTVTDKRGNTITNTYDGSGNLTSVTYPDGKKITYSYDTKNRISQISDGRYSTAKITKFSYDAIGNLTEINETNNISKFTYDSSGEVLTETDPALKKTTWTRDSLGNPLSETDPLINKNTFEYDSIARLTKKTDAENKIVSFTYDGNGNLLTQTDAIGTTGNNYDKENRPTKITYPDGNSSQLKYTSGSSLQSVTDALSSTTAYGYDIYQNLTSRLDALNRETTYQYDKLNRQTEEKTPKNLVSKWEYDGSGNIIKRVDPSRSATNYDYDAFNRLIKITYPDSKTVTKEYDNRGNLVKMTDPEGVSTFTYDNFDRLTKFINAKGSPITYEYNPVGTLKKLTYPDGKSVSYSYDNKHRLTTVTDWNFKQTKYTYFKNDLVATRTYPNSIVSSFAYDSANRLTSITHKKSTTTLAKYSYERDKIGNITKVYEEGSFISTPSFVNPTQGPTPIPKPVAVSDGPDLVITKLRISPDNPLKNPNSDADINVNLYVTVKNQGTQTVDQITVRFTNYFDLEELPTYHTPTADFSIISLDDENTLAPGQEKTLQYQTEVSHRIGQHSVWAMIDQQNIVAETNEDNNGFGPLVFNVISGTTTPTPTATVTPTPTIVITVTPTLIPTFTPTPTPVSLNGPDLIVTSVTTSIANPQVGENFDVVIKLKNQGNTATSGTVKTGIYYDRNSPPVITSYDDSESYYYTISPGQEVTVTETLTDFASVGTHNIWAYVDRDLNIAESNENNNMFGPFNVNVLAQGKNNTFLAKLLSFGSPVVYAQTTPLITTFTYDAIGRLTQAQYPNQSSYSYTYDKVGNITKKTQDLTDTYNYLDNDDRLKQSGQTLYYYDKNGNNIRRTAGFLEDPLLSFDFENRLTRYLSDVDFEYLYKYDGLGNRLEEHFTESIPVRYVTDINGGISRLLAETSTNPTSIKNYYLYGLGPISQGIAGSSFREYLLEDGLGNTRFVTNYTGAKKSSFDFDPFGNIWRSSGTSDPIFKFKGEKLDSATGLYYMRARYYDPTIGRFISRDPVSGLTTNPQSQNPYSYALNNPVNLSDPSGEYVDSIIDIAFLTYDICEGNWGWAAVDVAMLALPVINSAVIRGSAHVVQTSQKAKRIEKLQEAAKVGREVHKAYGYPAGFEKEVFLKSRKRVDALNEGTKQIIELKPNNPAAVKKGEKQLEGYLEELNRTKGPGWTGELWTY